jgi:hypothetical protein
MTKGKAVVDWLNGGNKMLFQDEIRTLTLEKMNENINNAIIHLEDANIAGYFEEMDKVEMPKQLKPTYAQFKGVFMDGQAPWDFSQQLETFAREVNKNLEKNDTEESNNTDKALPKTYKAQNIFKLINACYNDENLQLFCAFHFEAVAENFSTGMSKNQKIMALLDYTKRNLRTEGLLELVKEEHPQQYELHKPYC